MKVWFENDYKRLAQAYRKGMPAKKVIEVLERQRQVDSRGAEAYFWEELSEEEAERIREEEG